jgi:site-specific recombinase XerD
MTQLRQRMIEDLQLRGLSVRTQEMYVRAIRQLAEHDHTAPDCLTETALRAYLLSRKHVKHDSRSASTIALCGLKFCYAHTWQRAWTTLTCVRPPREKKLPLILSIAEVRTILAHLKRLRSRVCLTTIYACGLRLQEGTHLQVPDSDSARMLVHGRGGNGAKDRYGPLPQPTLAWLRQYWKTPRHPGWIFPAPGRGGIAMPTATAPMPSSSVPGAFRAALTATGSHKRASGHTLRHSSATHVRDAGVHRRLIQEYLGHHTPTTTALYTHLTRKADALARDALNRLMTDLERPRESSHDRAGGHLPARWTGVLRHIQRPHPPEPLRGHGGH